MAGQLKGVSLAASDGRLVSDRGIVTAQNRAPERWWSLKKETARLIGGVGLGVGLGYLLGPARRADRRERARETRIAASLMGLGALTAGAASLDLERWMRPGETLDLVTGVDIAAPPEEVFTFCTNYENYPRFWPDVREVREAGEGRIHWEIRGPAGMPIRWEEQLTEVIPNELIAWQNVPGAAIRYRGALRFHRQPEGGTRVELSMCFSPLVAAAGRFLKTLFGCDPKRQVDHDFSRLKALIEAGAARP